MEKQVFYSTVGRAGDGQREASKEVAREAEVVAAREAGGGRVREEVEGWEKLREVGEQEEVEGEGGGRGSRRWWEAGERQVRGGG